MRVGAERTNVRRLWPRALLPSDTRLIYLDLNQWIALAKADVGHEDGLRWQRALETLRTHRDGLTYVISMPLLAEVTGIRRRTQRQDLGEVIEEFTDYACVMPLTTIAPLELETALASFIPIAERHAPLPLVGRGVMQAFGMRGDLRISDKWGNDVTEEVRRISPLGPQEFDRRVAKAELALNRSVIRGPASEPEEEELRTQGWNPSAAYEVAQTRAEQEREQAARFAAEPRWRRGRTRDVIAARYLELEIEEIREEILDLHGVRMKDALTDPEQARRFTDSMPAADIWITLMTAKHRNSSTAWKPNDIFDVDALSVAAAYCDIVVTEKHAVHVLKRAGVPETHQTQLLTDLDQLAAHVSGAKA